MSHPKVNKYQGRRRGCFDRNGKRKTSPPGETQNEIHPKARYWRIYKEIMTRSPKEHQVIHEIEKINHGEKEILMTLDDKDYTLLERACRQRLIEVCLLLLEKVPELAKPHMNSIYRKTVLMTASDMGLTSVVKALLETGLSEPDRIGYGGWTALFIACRKRHAETAMVLVESGLCDLTYACWELGDALCQSCQAGLTDVALAILKTGEVEPNAALRRRYRKRYVWLNPLQLACLNGMTEVALELLKYDTAFEDNYESQHVLSSLATVCRKRMTEVVKAMTELNLLPTDVPDPVTGMTPLEILAESEQQETALELLLSDHCTKDEVERIYPGFTALRQNNLTHDCSQPDEAVIL